LEILTASNFYVSSPIQQNNAGESDIFVSVINASGSAIPFSTYYGGSSYDSGSGVALDNIGGIYVVGLTSSSDFPTASPLQGTYGGSTDAVVFKLGETPTLIILSTFKSQTARQKSPNQMEDCI